MVTRIHPRPSRHRDPVRFRPAHVAVSRGARSSLDLADCSPRTLLLRHTRADWGLLRDDDARENDWALDHAAPVRSLFELPTGARMLLETDGERRITYFLLEGADPDSRPPVAASVPLAVSGRARETPAPTPPSPPVFHGPASLADILPSGAHFRRGGKRPA